MNPLLDTYAHVLVTYCLALKPGEKVLIRSSILGEPLVKEVYKKALEAGAFPEIELSFSDQEFIFYSHANNDQLQYSSLLYKTAVETFDALLNIRAPFNKKELQSIPKEKLSIRQKSMAPIKKIFMERSAKKALRWGLCEYPTLSGAQECGMSLREYETFVFEACFLTTPDPILEWQKLGQFQQGIVDRLNTMSDFRFKGPDTDISFSTKNRICINSDGKRNMPSGEVFTSPVENSVNGTIFFNFPTLYQGKDVQGVTLVVKEGEVVQWDAKIGKEALDQAFEIPGSRFFGEAAIGTNTHIQRPSKNILFDEKISGSIHMAIGASYPETGGKNESGLHWDLIKDMTSGEIYGDNTLIYKNGSFIN